MARPTCDCDPGFVESFGHHGTCEHADVATLEQYYTGAQPVAFLAPEVRTAAGNRLTNLTTNWPRMVVGAVEERCDVEGFRLAADEPADAELWRVWQANSMDEQSQLGHEAAMVYGSAYVMVWASGDPRTPRITVESPRQVTVARDPATGAVTAALKRWTQDGYGRATLYQPDAIRRLRSRAKVVEHAGTVPATGWDVVETVLNPLGVVPVIPLVNRPRLGAPDGESELIDCIPLVDGINKLCTDMMVSSEFHALPRRWAVGIELPEDDQGDVATADPLSTVAGRTWFFEDPETKVGQFPEANLSGFIDAVQLLTRQLAALAGLPPHFVGLSFDQPASADAVRAAEASLASKARRRQRVFGGAWEQIMRLAVLVRDGVASSGLDALEVVWRDPETRTVAQAADAAVKLVQTGIIGPDSALESMGYSPTAIERIRTQRRAAALDRFVTDTATGGSVAS